MILPSDLKAALACGVAGAYVDVTDYLRGNEPMTVSEGKVSQFDNTPPKVFSFTLDNSDGRFTPDNTGSPLATTLFENMGVCIQIGSRLTAGTIRSITPFFRSSLGSSAQVRITADDMLGDAARRQLTDTLPDSMVLGSPAYLYWPFNESAGATVALEQSGNSQPPMGVLSNGSVTFGAAGFAALAGDTQIELFNDSQGFPVTFGTGFVNPFQTIPYGANSMGAWGFWVTSTAATSQALVRIRPNGFLSSDFEFGLNGSNQYSMAMGNSYFTASTPVVTGVPRYVSLTVTNDGSTSITGQLAVDGVVQGSLVFVPFGADAPGLATNALRTPKAVFITFELYPPSMALTRVAHLSHTAALVPEYQSPQYTTEATLLTAVKQAVPEIAFSTLPTDLSSLPVTSSSASSALDRINDIIRTEQGAVSTVTTGTLLAPVQQIAVRARTRPAGVAYTFDVLDIVDAPEFIRSINDAVSTVNVTGSGTTVAVKNDALVPRLGSASTSATVLNYGRDALAAWGQDRINRGIVTGVPVVSVTINARTTSTDRWADLLAAAYGDRIRITGLPATQLGYSTWDGWLIGKRETHTYERGDFTLYFQPTLPATAVYDTDRYMADGALTLSAGINSSVTTMSVATSNPLALLETAAFPYTLILDTEQVTVTACTSATPQVATITRGANGTAAAAHSAAALVDVYPPALYAF